MGRKRKRGGGDDGGGGGMMRWLLTYSDLITLLVAFFVVMYASSQTDTKKFQALAGAMQEAFNTGGGGGNNIVFTSPGTGVIEPPNPKGQSSKLDEVTKERLAMERMAEKSHAQTENKEFNQVASQINKYAKDEGIASSIKMNIDERGLVISIQDTVFFESGKADLQPSAREVLDKVAKIIYTLPNAIRIEGHTDNVPIKTSEYPDNWRLSTDRAITVLMYLQNNHGFKADRLSAAGYGEFHPKADNSTEAGRAQNRRVDIVILRSSVDQSQGDTTIQGQLNLDKSVVK